MVLHGHDAWDPIISDIQVMVDPEVVEEIAPLLPHDTWEYRLLVTRQPENAELAAVALNELGLEGWECYQVDRVSIPFSNEIWYYFKRRTVHGSAPDTSKN